MEYANFAQLDHSLMLIKIDAYAQEANAAPSADQTACQCNSGFVDYNNNGNCIPACLVNQ